MSATQFAPRRAGDLRDHDVVEGYGRVDWTAGVTDGRIKVAFIGENGRQIEDLPVRQIVRARRM